jgi:hypothetical protein
VHGTNSRNFVSVLYMPTSVYISACWAAFAPLRPRTSYEHFKTDDGLIVGLHVDQMLSKGRTIELYISTSARHCQNLPILSAVMILHGIYGRNVHVFAFTSLFLELVAIVCNCKVGRAKLHGINVTTCYRCCQPKRLATSNDARALTVPYQGL